MLLPLLQAAAATAPAAHPLAGTLAEYVWLLPLLPLLGFVLNGLLSLTSVFRFGPDDPGAEHGGEAHPVAAHDHGIPEVRAAGLLALMGVFDLAGTTASGWLSDRWDSRRLLAWYYGLRGLSLLFLPFALATPGTAPGIPERLPGAMPSRGMQRINAWV